MAALTINTADVIEFRDIRQSPDPKNAPFITVQLGDWDIDKHVERGIIVDSSGPDEYPTILSGNDARKLAKWLNRAADTLDAASNTKQTKKRTHYERDDEDDYKY